MINMVFNQEFRHLAPVLRIADVAVDLRNQRSPAVPELARNLIA